MKIPLLTVLLLGPVYTAFAQKTMLIGPGVRNGDFNEDTSGVDQRTFNETPSWENYYENQNLVTSRTNLTNLDGSRNARLNHSAT